MKTLFLTVPDWDLALDASGNIALASEPYALAQDAACAIRTFLGECWYNTALGVPYLQQVLGVTPVPSIQYLKSLLVRAALTVPNVVAAQVFIQEFINNERGVVGQVQVTDTAGVITAVSF